MENKDLLERAMNAEAVAWECWSRLEELVGDPEAVAAGIKAVLATDEQRQCFDRMRAVMRGDF